jgi:hypothetical protein
MLTREGCDLLFSQISGGINARTISILISFSLFCFGDIFEHGNTPTSGRRYLSGPTNVGLLAPASIAHVVRFIFGRARFIHRLSTSVTAQLARVP